MSQSTANVRRTCRICDLTNIRVLYIDVCSGRVSQIRFSQTGSQETFASFERWSWVCRGQNDPRLVQRGVQYILQITRMAQYCRFSVLCKAPFKASVYFKRPCN